MFFTKINTEIVLFTGKLTACESGKICLSSMYVIRRTHEMVRLTLA